MNSFLRLLCCLAILAVSFVVLPAHPVYAASLNVNTLSDADASDGSCSLREAIMAARNNAVYKDCPAGSGDDTITFSVSGTINLTSSLTILSAGGKVTIDGGNAIIIDGTAVDAIFDLNMGNLDLRNITITNGKYGVSTLYGTLSLDHVTLTHMNRADSMAILSHSAAVIVQNSTFSDNIYGLCTHPW